MHLGMLKLIYYLKRTPCFFAVCGRYREGYKNLIGVKPWVMIPEILRFKCLYRLKYFGRYNVGVLIYSRKHLKSVQKSRA